MGTRPKAPGDNGRLSLEELVRRLATLEDARGGDRVRGGLAPVAEVLARGGRGDLALELASAMAFDEATHFATLFRIATLDPDRTRARAALDAGRAVAARFFETRPAFGLWVRSAARAAAEVRLGDPDAVVTISALRDAPSSSYRDGLSPLVIALVEGGDLDQAFRVARETAARPATPGATPGPRSSTDSACVPLALALSRAGRVDDALETYALLAAPPSPTAMTEDACARGEPLAVIERWASLSEWDRATAIEVLVEQGRPEDGAAVHARWPADRRIGAGRALWVAARARLGGALEPEDASILRALLVDHATREPDALHRLALEGAFAAHAERAAPDGRRGREVEDAIAMARLAHRGGDAKGASTALVDAKEKALTRGEPWPVVHVVEALASMDRVTDAVALLARLRAEHRSHGVRAVSCAYARHGDLAGVAAAAAMLPLGSDAYVDTLSRAFSVVFPS